MRVYCQMNVHLICHASELLLVLQLNVVKNSLRKTTKQSTKKWLI